MIHLQLASAPCVDGVPGGRQALAALDAALLAWLALEGPTPRNRLAALLWPETPADAARNSLRQRLFRLRRQLGCDLVEGQGTVALAPGVEHDLDGADTVLDGVDVEIAGEFSEWLATQRDRRRLLLRSALVQQAEAAERARDWDGALLHAGELLALEPLSEEAHRRLMQLHYLRGDRAAALLAFDRCERVLKDEVGTRPSPETLALLATVEGSGLPAAPAAAAPRLRVPVSVQRPPRLVGREAEWAALHEAWDGGRIAVVLGDGGLGKTRLVTDFAKARGAVVVGARPGDEAVVHALASRLLRQCPRAVLDALPEGVRGELAQLLPELGAVPAAGPDARTRFFNAVAALVEGDWGTAEPVGIVVDDLHFADAASVELLQYLALQSRRRWVFAGRAAELQSPAAALVAAAREAGAAVLPLAPLGLAAVTELLASLAIDGLDAEAAAPALLRHTGGNPLYLLETLKAWWMQPGAADPGGAAVARLPAQPSVTALIERRIGQLSRDAVQLARCAAIAAPDFGVELAAQVLGVRTIDLADPLAELEAAQVLRDGAFVHDLIYESALASVPRLVARQLHADVAAYLAAHGGEPARVAAHWLGAGRDAQAVEALLAAAAAAGQALRVREQSGLLRHAADVAERMGRRDIAFDALQRLCAVLTVGDRTALDDELLGRFERLADTPAQRLAALVVRAEAVLNRGDYDAAIAAGEAGAALARTLGDPERELDAVRCAAQACSFRGESQRAVQLLRMVLPWVLQNAPAPQQKTFFIDFAACLDNADLPDEAQSYHQRALDLALQTGRLDEAATVHGNLAVSLRNSGLSRRALASIQTARRIVAGFDDAQGASWHLDLGAFALLRDLGRYAEALRARDVALQAMAQHPFALPSFHGHEAILWIHLGQPARAAQSLDAGRARGLPPHLAARYAQIEGRRLAAQGLDARGVLTQAAQNAPRAGRTVMQAFIALDHALVLEPPAALAACEAVIARCGALGYRGAVLAGHIRASRFALAAGQAAQAAAHAREALATDPEVFPDDLYEPERWLVAARAFEATGDADGLRATVEAGVQALREVAETQVMAEFRDGFLQRNPVNRELLAFAARLGGVQPAGSR